MMAQPDSLVTFTTPKGREMKGRVLLRGDSHVAVVTEHPRMTFIVADENVTVIPARAEVALRKA